MRQSSKAYAAIRKDSDTGDEYIDYSSIGCLANEVRKAVTREDKQMPLWAKYNPVMRVVEIEIFEMEEK